jgi:hypothetical protein
MGRVCFTGSYNTGTAYQCGCSTCSNASYYAGSYSAPSYYAGTDYSCNCSTCSNSSYYAGSYSAPSYYAGTTYNCNCQTCYPIYVRVFQSIASTVSTLTTWTLSGLAQSLRIKTKANQITVQAFSDNLVTQIGNDLVYTGTGVVVTSNYGIIVYPSSTSQGTTLGEIEINQN